MTFEKNKIIINNLNISLKHRELRFINEMMKENNTKVILSVIESKENNQLLICHKTNNNNFGFFKIKSYKIDFEVINDLLPYMKTIGKYCDPDGKHTIFKPDKHIQHMIESSIKKSNKLTEFEVKLLKHMYMYSLRINQNSENKYYISKIYNENKILIKDEVITKLTDISIIEYEYKYDWRKEANQYKLTKQARKKFKEIIRPKLEKKFDMSIKEWFDMSILMREYIVRRKSERILKPIIN